jgi:rubrerythrin
MLIIGMRFFTWGSGYTEQPWRCGQCSTVGHFIRRRGMRFLTLFFFIPVLPLSGAKHLAQCPTCGARYEERA